MYAEPEPAGIPDMNTEPIGHEDCSGQARQGDQDALHAFWSAVPVRATPAVSCGPSWRGPCVPSTVRVATAKLRSFFTSNGILKAPVEEELIGAVAIEDVRRL